MTRETCGHERALWDISASPSLKRDVESCEEDVYSARTSRHLGEQRVPLMLEARGEVDGRRNCEVIKDLDALLIVDGNCT